MNQCSELFMKVFSSGCSGVVRTCTCGRTVFDSTDFVSYDDGELDDLIDKSYADPDKYIAVDHSVRTLVINGVEIVDGCKCDVALSYERFIRANAICLAEYLRGYSKLLHEHADAVNVPEV